MIVTWVIDRATTSPAGTATVGLDTSPCQDLRELLGSAPWSAAAVTDLLLGLGRGLDLLHQKDVVRRLVRCRT